jgi:hypothetical protein
MALRAEVKVTTGAANVLSELLTQRMRDANAFSRVVNFRELEDTLSAEQQRQLLNCEASSCLAEIAGAMGVDLLLTGSVGQLGQVLVVNLRLIAAHSGLAKGSVSETFTGGLDSVVLNAEVLVHNLLIQNGYIQGRKQALQQPRPPPRARRAVRQQAQDKEASEGGGPSGIPLLALGGASGLGSVVTVILAGALGVLGLVVLVVPVLVAIPAPLMPIAVKSVLIQSASGTLGFFSVVFLAVSVVLLVGGVLGAGVGLWLR